MGRYIRYDEAADNIKQSIEYFEAVLNHYNIRFIPSRGSTRGMISCFNTAAHPNGDRNPSMGYTNKTGQVVFHCNKCNISGTILDVILRNDSEVKLLTEAIEKAYDILGLDITQYIDNDINKEIYIAEKRERDILSSVASAIVEYLEKYGDNTYFMERFGTELYLKAKDFSKINGVKNIEHLKSFLIDKGFGPHIWSDYVVNSLLPIENNMTSIECVIPVFTMGKVNGFIIRDSKTNKKYKNSKRSSLFKREFYFPYPRFEEGYPLVMTEGVFDAVALMAMGVKNVIALLGGTIPDDFLYTIKEYININAIELMFDNDTTDKNGNSAGKEITFKTIESLISQMGSADKIGYIDIRVLLNYGAEGTDPDDYCKEHTLSDFMNLQRTSAIEFYIEYLTNIKNMTSENSTLKTIDLIAKVPLGPISTHRLAQDISKLTGIESSIIEDEISLIRSGQDVRNTQIIEKLWKDAYETSKDGGYDIQILALDTLRDQLVKQSRRLSSKETTIAKQELDSILSSIKSSEYYDLGITSLVNRHNNKPIFALPKDEPFIMVVAGDSHVGKSSFIRYLALNLSRLNHYDTIVLYFSIDDPKRATIKGLLSCLSCKRISDIDNEYVMNEIQDKTRILKDMYGESLFIFDAKDAASEIMINATIMKYKNANKNKHVIAIIDNLHNIEDIAGSQKFKREATERTINNIKLYAERGGYGVICTAEVTKNPNEEIRSSLEAKETGTIYYRSVISSVVNCPAIDEYKSAKISGFTNIVPQTKYKKSNQQHRQRKQIQEETDNDDILTPEIDYRRFYLNDHGLRDVSDYENAFLPIFDLHIEKDKVKGFGGSIPFVYIPERNQFFEMTLDYKDCIKNRELEEVLNKYGIV